MQIHRTRYRSNPAPKARKQKRNTALHIHVGRSVAKPNPPQRPPIHRSVDDLFRFFMFSHALTFYLLLSMTVIVYDGEIKIIAAR
jgi:hypothetical protein